MRLPCKFVANFSITKRNSVLVGSVIDRLQSVDLKECQQECLSNENCRSINHKGDGADVCEINSEVSEKFGEKLSFQSRKGWQFISTDFNYPLVSRIIISKYQTLISEGIRNV